MDTSTSTSMATTITSAIAIWDSPEEAVAAMVECVEPGPCEVEWPTDTSSAPEMPQSIQGYQRDGETTLHDFRVLGDGTASLTFDFPYLLGDCAAQIWTARWRSITGETISGAVIPATPDAPLDLPWNPNWGDVAAPSQSGFLAGFGCTQPAWTFMDSDTDFVIIADGVVEWQVWHATP
jgi:hypothetical protein